MTPAGHTKGPFRVDVDPYRPGKVKRFIAVATRDGFRKILAHVHAWPGMPAREIDLNAALFSAAPELLACCKVELGDLNNDVHDDPARIERRNRLRAAIEKAETVVRPADGGAL